MKPTHNPEEKLTIADIVNEYNGKVKYSTVRKYIKTGIIKGNLEFGKWFVTRSSLEAYKNSNLASPPPIIKPLAVKKTSNLKPSQHSDIYQEVMANYNLKQL